MERATARDRLIDSLRKRTGDDRVIDAMSRVPRELFVLPSQAHAAWEDRALPAGFGQTISQPTIVAMMTQALRLTGAEKVLEIGTGTGYQTAILAELAATVLSVERIPDLSSRARNVLDKLGYTNITLYPAGETLGRPEDSPYDAIITTAGAPSIPPELVSQLVPEGRLVIPVGTRNIQELLAVTRHASGISIEKLGGCQFVPLIGPGAWNA